MATSEVWTVRGVGEESRKKAKMAAAAYGETVGAWLERVIGMAAPFPAEISNPEEKQEEAAYVESVAAEPEKKRAAVKKVCRHGTEKGFNCWQCGGLAVVV